MNYFRVRIFNEKELNQSIEECKIYKSKSSVKMNDVVVIESPIHDFPITAEVVAIVNERKALTARYHIEEVIAVVDMSEYNMKLEQLLQKEILAEKMKAKMDEVKLMENFKKFSEKDDDMRELFKQYQAINSDIYNIDLD